VPLFETRESDILLDPAILDAQSDPPGGVPLCRETYLDIMATNVSQVFRTGRARNIFVWGPPGSGKTASVQYLLRETQQHSSTTGALVATAYVNAGRTRNPYYTLTEILRQMNIAAPDVGWQFFRLKQVFENALKEKSALIAIDEVESILFKEKEPLIYYLNRQPKTTLILISNKLSQATQLPEKCLSTLQPLMISFKPYSGSEAFMILKARAQRAFRKNVISDEALETVAKATEKMEDIRLGIAILLTAAQSAEQHHRTAVNKDDVNFAIEDALSVKKLQLINELSKQAKKHGRSIDF
jgi:cell division control protein 6